MSVGPRGIAIHPLRPPPERRRLFPSVLTLTAATTHDPAEFTDALDAHAALIARHGASLLFLARRHSDEPAMVDLFVDDLVGLIGSVESSRSSGRPDSVGMIERVEVFRAMTPFRAIRRRLVLRPDDGAFYVVVMTPAAASLRRVRIVKAPSNSGLRYVLETEADVIVEPIRQRTKFFRRWAFTWSRTPRHWLRVDAFRRPAAPTSPDEEIDRLVTVYAAEIRRASWRASQASSRPGQDSFATIDSCRWAGDRVDVWEHRYKDALLGDQSRLVSALDRAPHGWLGAIVRTEEHMGLRWVNVAGDASLEPTPVAAFVPFHRRLRLATPD